MEREFWLKRPQLVPRPLVAASKILPVALVQHLLSHKSSEAFKRKHGHKISHMEGACHSLVVPTVFPTYISGITGFQNGKHTILPIPQHEPPIVLLSALVQPDFEFKTVMYEMIKLENEKVQGRALEKSSRGYSDRDLKLNFVYHFASSHSLPPITSVSEDSFTSGQYMRNDHDVLSLEMLRGIVLEQLKVEMAALTHYAKKYSLKLVYTWDPPAIFAKTLSSSILNEIWAEAITTPGILSEYVVCVAFNDYNDVSIIPRLRSKLPSRVTTCRKKDVVLKPGEFRVLHMNGDAFGLHILTQPVSTSLEGAIGSASSAAASLCLREAHPILWV